MHYMELIQLLMTEKNLTQEQLANILGVNQTAVSAWIRGTRKPSYDSIWAFYEKFGIEPNEFFGL